MKCTDCERYKLSASMWRAEAYKHAGTPLPWEPEELLRKEYERGYADANRKWVGLTDEEVSAILDREIGFNSCWGPETDFARAIEAKLKEKNT